MKRVYIILSLILLVSAGAKAAPGIERVYLGTDKNVYVAGENLWISAFCFDISASKPELSKISSVVYAELHSSAGAVLTTKIALKGGRGSGVSSLPVTLPTGNYKLIGYTSYMRNESPIPVFEKTISVYNTVSASRDASVVVMDSPSDSIRSSSSVQKEYSAPFIELAIPYGEALKRESAYEFSLSNKSSSALNTSISVTRAEVLPDYSKENLLSFLEGGFVNRTELSDKYIAEYEGEIIKGRLTGAGTNGANLSGVTVFLSVPKGNAEIYTSSVTPDGKIAFFTDNIYGNREFVLEVRSPDTTSRYSVELDDPFARPALSAPVKLQLLPWMQKPLEERSFAMQVAKRFGADTLFERVVPRHNPLLNEKKWTYLLDDYTRFPVMEEVIIEYVTELRYRKNGNSAQLQVRREDSFNSLSFTRDNTLAILDGIPVFDHMKILQYDPLKVKSLEIYGGIYYIGNISFTGIVSFKTYKGDYPGLKFDKNVRILDFSGVQYPVKFTGKEAAGGKIPDFRHTVYWDPVAQIAANGEKKFTVFTPSLPGKYIVTIEGLDQSGKAFRFQKDFNIE